LRLLAQPAVETNNRAHFLMVAARLMRQILVDHARSHGAEKRGADRTVYLDPAMVLPQERSIDLLALDDALNDLSRLDEQQGRVVELRFFGGLATEEIAEVLSISCSTVRRDWNVAKLWLTRQLKKQTQGGTDAVAQS
jgi:RNA polymerase sigma-70 factor (ECF subfamily)